MRLRHTVIQRYLYKIPVPAALLLASMTLISGCASDSGDYTGRSGGADPASRVLACKSTDKLIERSDQCLLDDAACYQISSGQWCTGPRGNVCPAGSQPLAEGSTCPVGARCFSVGESLECRI